MKKVTKSNYENIVYISHAYGGKAENIDEVTDIIHRLYEKYPTYLFISPIHTFGHMYDYTDYKEGLNMTLLLLQELADEMWYVQDENSKGVQAEICYCRKFNIPFKEINPKTLEVV